MRSQHLINRIQTGHQVTITFIVDTPICVHCRPWFENTVWNALNTAGNTFELHVNVVTANPPVNATVEVTGDNTIWPNEITDDPTWERLRPYDLMHRFVTEQRNPDENEFGETGYQYIGQNEEGTLNNQMQFFGNDDDFKDMVEQSLNLAKVQVIPGLLPMYDFENAQAMQDELNPITLLTLMTTAPTLSIPDIHSTAINWNWGIWQNKLVNAFKWWLETWINDNLEDHEWVEENPHFG